jgi:hypothetical protein
MFRLIGAFSAKYVSSSLFKTCLAAVLHLLARAHVARRVILPHVYSRQGAAEVVRFAPVGVQ